MAVLVGVEQERIYYLSQEEGFLSHLARVRQAFERCIGEPRWFQRTHPDRQDMLVTYFSAEYGLSSALPVYSGGPGVLPRHGDVAHKYAAYHLTWAAGAG